MSKARPPADDNPQLGLFSSIFEPAGSLEGDFCNDQRIRQAVRQSIKNSGLDHFQIAMEMSRLLEPSGYEITKSIVDSWTRNDPAWSMPVKALAAFCRVTNDLTVIRIVLEPLQARIAEPREGTWSELGKIKIEKAKLAEREARLTKQLLKEK